ncbi:MAG: hypothetical protein DMF56_08085 [Acidobacteria bacterium]|nr:MAG: hypothetical protein DMF56_08085 [Acidobacteriota bacterium]
MANEVLYFHAPCFDGIASAVIASEFLTTHHGWSGIELRPVDYSVRTKWLSIDPGDRMAVVDFLFHPRASFWADHHTTSFLDERSRSMFQRDANPLWIYDEDAPSCAGLLWRTLENRFGFRAPRFADLMQAAEKIDAAAYQSVHEAMSTDTPDMLISASLAVADADYCAFLVRALRDRDLREVAESPNVRQRAERTASLSQAGLDRLRDTVRVRNEIILFEVDAHGVMLNRYAPWLFFPEARYSVGVVRGDHGTKVTTMRNPWREFESVHLGEIAQRFGGGGHQRVASIVVPAAREHDASAIAQQIAADITAAEDAERMIGSR